MYMRENLNDVTEIVLPFNDVTSDVTDNDFHGGENPFSRAEGLMYPVSTLIYDFDPWPPPKRRSCFVLGPGFRVDAPGRGRGGIGPRCH